jgi:hypothetical protein
MGVWIKHCLKLLPAGLRTSLLSDLLLFSLVKLLILTVYIGVRLFGVIKVCIVSWFSGRKDVVLIWLWQIELAANPRTEMS